MKEIKTNTHHYYENDKGQLHGEYKEYYDNGKIKIHHNYHNGQNHGEYKWYSNESGALFNIYYANNKKVHDFIKDCDTPEIRMFLYFTYAAPFLENKP